MNVLGGFKLVSEKPALMCVVCVVCVVCVCVLCVCVCLVCVCVCVCVPAGAGEMTKPPFYRGLRGVFLIELKNSPYLRGVAGV